jgi:TonB family protein
MGHRFRSFLLIFPILLSAGIATAGVEALQDGPVPIADGFGKGAYPLGSVSIPIPIDVPEPEYTPEARAAGIEGSLVVLAVVRADGTVGDVAVVKSDRLQGLYESAVSAMKKGTFKPGERDGVPVAAVTPFTFVFRLHPPGRDPDDPVPASAEDAEFAGDAYRGSVKNLVVPTVLQTVPPRYTPEAMRKRIQGYVWLDVVIGVDGRVRNARVQTSLDPGKNGLDAEALIAARKWRFEPGRLNGERVAVVATLLTSFRLH